MKLADLSLLSVGGNLDIEFYDTQADAVRLALPLDDATLVVECDAVIMGDEQIEEELDNLIDKFDDDWQPDPEQFIKDRADLIAGLRLVKVAHQQSCISKDEHVVLLDRPTVTLTRDEMEQLVAAWNAAQAKREVAA